MVVDDDCEAIVGINNLVRVTDVVVEKQPQYSFVHHESHMT
jgi:hypothetical protein